MGADFLQTAVPSDFMKDIFIDWGRVGSMMAILVTGNHVDMVQGALTNTTLAHLRESDNFDRATAGE